MLGTPMPIHRLSTQFPHHRKTNALLEIEPAAPPPSQSPSWHVNPLHRSTTPGSYSHKVHMYVHTWWSCSRMSCGMSCAMSLHTIGIVQMWVTQSDMLNSDEQKTALFGDGDGAKRVARS